MSNTKLSSYSREELTDILRVLKDYRTSLKQIGNRSILSDSKEKKEKIFKIEHTKEISENFLQDFSEKAIKRFFPEADSSVRREYILNEKIIGGIRVFYGDDMMDLSFQDFVHAFN